MSCTWRAICTTAVFSSSAWLLGACGTADSGGESLPDVTEVGEAQVAEVAGSADLRGGTDEPNASPVTGEPTSAASDASPTTIVGANRPDEGQIYVLDAVGLTVGGLPNGFVPILEANVTGTQEIDHRSRSFAGGSEGGIITVAVTRGELPPENEESLREYRPEAAPTDLRIGGRTVYRIAFDGVDEGIVEFFWFHDDETLFAVVGQGFLDEEALLTVAESFQPRAVVEGE